MFYFHIADLIKEKNRIMSRKSYEEYFRETGTLKRRVMHWICSNARIGDTQQKLCKIIHNNDFLNLAQANVKIDWTQATKIIL